MIASHSFLLSIRKVNSGLRGWLQLIYKTKNINSNSVPQLEDTDLKLEANIAARRARHRKVFAGVGSLDRYNPLNLLKTFGLSLSPVFLGNKNKSLEQPRIAPANKLFRNFSIAVSAVMIIGMISPTSANTLNSSYAPTLEGVEDFYLSSNALFADQDGYIPKINPQTELADRTIVNGKLVHEIKAGETLSGIATEYGLKTQTVLWENGLTASSTIKPGQKLFIPPVDGVTHKVKKDQDVVKIATLYEVESAAIVRQNQLAEDASLSIGEELFIPGAKPLPAPVVRTSPSLIATSSRISTGSAVVPSNQIGVNSEAAPATGKVMIWPTRGKVTQGYRAGHYAIDIADVRKPPIWSAAGGTVEKVSVGTWGGGYGNHIIIDHGNGLKTLYAHMETVAVSTGQYVDQGQVIGKMGRTGRVYGRTGIHLHFEVHKNGVKQNPGNYF